MPRFTIKLPDGPDLVATGRFIALGRLPNRDQAVGVLCTENQFVDGHWVRKGQPLKLSPLSVVLNEQNALIYSPRDASESLDETYRLWLAEHPEWPGDIAQVAPPLTV